MKLGDVLKLNKSSLIDIKDNQTYEISGVQNYGQGIVIRRKVLGSELNMKKYQSISKNQLMWCKVDTKNGAFGLTHDEHIGSLASTNMALADINTNRVNPEFLEVLFRQKAFADYITKYSSGTTNRKYLTPKQLFEKIELPNLNLVEQQEFIAKLERIEKIDVESEIQIQKQLLTKLKQCILQEAIQGKLTADWRVQNPNPESASDLLKRIKAEKVQLIKDKKIKKEKALPPITEEEIPFELPEGWVWCRLGEISTYLNGKGFNSTDFKKNIGVKCIKITNAGVGEIVETDDTLPAEFINEYSAYLVYENDIVIALTRPYIADGLKVSLCSKSYDKSLLNQRVAVVRACSNIQNKYIYKYLRTKFVLDGYKREFDSTGQQPNLKTDHVTNLIFPLAPVEEQKAIVEKVESLMQKCQALEQEIKTSESNAKMLMQAVLKEAFEVKQEEYAE
jgi:type I restriction enzyme S subunit